MIPSFSLLRLLARLTLPFVIGIAVLLGLICSRGYDSRTVMAFFADSCTAMPCWQGIYPGGTSMNQALAILSTHPWVAQISEVYTSPKSNSSGTVLIYWTWSAAYPFINGVRTSHQQGIIVSDQGIVRQIYLTTSIPLGDLWLAFGGAQGNVLNSLYDRTQTRLRVDNTALFSKDGIAATASLYGDCLTELASFWQTPVYLWLRSNLPLPDLAPVNLQYQQVRASFC